MGIFKSGGWGITEDWYGLAAVLNFGVCDRPKKNSNSTQIIMGFRADKTSTIRWSGGRVQVESKFKPLLVIWQSLPKVIREDNRRFLLQNPWPSGVGSVPAMLGLVWRASTNTGRFQVGGSRCWPRQARLRKTCFHSCDTESVCEWKRIECFLNFGPWRVTFCFHVKCNFRWNWWRRCRPMQCPLLRSIFRSFVGFWVKIWHRNKTACSESNPVQSSRSKSTTCPVVGRLLRFESNSTVITDGCAKAWKRCMAWFWIDSNQTLQPNRSQKKCYVWKQCIDQHWQDELRFSTWRGFVFRNLPL